jgi:hypothetical protein
MGSVGTDSGSTGSGSTGSVPSDTIRATAVAYPTVDIDVDSNNSGGIDETDDPIEDIDSSLDVPAEARVFQNIDDDNGNTKADKDDAQFKPEYEDLDLAEAQLSADDLRVINNNPLKKDGTYRLWLGVPVGLNVFADRRRTPLTPDGTDGIWRSWNTGIILVGMILMILESSGTRTAAHLLTSWTTRFRQPQAPSRRRSCSSAPAG